MKKLRVLPFVFATLFGFSLFLTGCGEEGGGDGGGETASPPKCCADCQPKKPGEIEGVIWKNLNLPIGEKDLLCKETDTEMHILHVGIADNAGLKTLVDTYLNLLVGQGYAELDRRDGVEPKPFLPGKDYMNGEEVVHFFQTGRLKFEFKFAFQQGQEDVVALTILADLNAELRPTDEQARSIHGVNVMLAGVMVKALEAGKAGTCDAAAMEKLATATEMGLVKMAKLYDMSQMDEGDAIASVDPSKPHHEEELPWQDVMRNNRILASHPFLMVDVWPEGAAEYEIRVYSSSSASVICVSKYRAGDDAARRKAIAGIAGDREVVDYTDGSAK